MLTLIMYAFDFDSIIYFWKKIFSLNFISVKDAKDIKSAADEASNQNEGNKHDNYMNDTL